MPVPRTSMQACPPTPMRACPPTPMHACPRPRCATSQRFVGHPLHHAQTCVQYLGPITVMSCADSELMPINVDGVEVFGTPASCDRSSAHTGTCETGERIASRYTGTYQDGSPRPEVVFVNFCLDGGMWVIGHNSKDAQSIIADIGDLGK